VLDMGWQAVKNGIPEFPRQVLLFLDICSYSKWRLKYFQRENWLAVVSYYQNPMSVSTHCSKSPTRWLLIVCLPTPRMCERSHLCTKCSTSSAQYHSKYRIFSNLIRTFPSTAPCPQGDWLNNIGCYRCIIIRRYTWGQWVIPVP